MGPTVIRDINDCTFLDIYSDSSDRSIKSLV